MAKLLNPREPVPLVPGDQAALPEDRQIRYHLRVPVLIDRTRYRQAIARAGGRQHGQLALLEALRDGIERVLPEDYPAEARAFFLRVIDERRAQLLEYVRMLSAGEFDLVTEDGKAAFAEATNAVMTDVQGLEAVELMVRQLDERYGVMVAEDNTYWEIAGIEGARQFLEGWDNVVGPDGQPAEFRRGRSGVSDALLELVPYQHFAIIGRKLHEMMRPTDRETKNSESPSPSGSTPTPSAAASTPPSTPPSAPTTGSA